MEFSLSETLSSLNPMDLVILLIIGTVLFFISLSKRIPMRVNILMFILVLSASLVGSTIPLVDTITALVRWLSLFLLLIVVGAQGRFRVPLGLLLFWGYIFLGLVFLLDAISFSWQLQKGLLLLIVAVAIPFSHSRETYRSLKLSLVLISVAATIYALLNFISLPGHINEAERFSGYSQGAASFAMVLGGFLPFTFWGLWRADNGVIRIACGSGFLFGLIALIFSGQRAGTVGGMIGLIPLLLTFLRKKNIGRFLFIITVTFLLGYILLQHSSGNLVDFLSSRYSADAELSGREWIWSEALSEIDKNPLLGRGIGAAETVIPDSFHNAYLEIWFNTGLVGLLLFLASQFYFVYRIVYLRRISEDPENRSVLALALGYMMGFVAICMFESPAAGSSNVNLILYLFLGVLVSSNHLVSYTQPSNSPDPIPQQC
jgi:O-antigen ligase